MPSKGIDLEQARVLITNDDGYDAPGLKALRGVAESVARDVWQVAPETEQSGAGHSLTLKQPLRLRKLARRRFAVGGTPTDCVLMAVRHVMRDNPPDLVLSGINWGGNLGEDVTYSGTIAAAMEAVILDVPAVAISQYVRREAKPKWPTAAAHLPSLLQRLTARSWPRHVLININIPDCAPDEVKGIRFCGQGQRKMGGSLIERVDPRGASYFWIGAVREDRPTQADTDLDAVLNGYIAVTPLHLDLTYRPTMRALAAEFNND